MTHPASWDETASGLYLYEDAHGATFEPFALTRPVCTLMAGSARIWERWQTALQLPVRGIVGCSRLVDFEEPGSPDVAADSVVPAGAVLAHSRFAPMADVIPWRGTPDAPACDSSSADADAVAWRNAGRAAAIRLARDVTIEELEQRSAHGAMLDELASREGHTAEIGGWWHEAVWDFIRYLPEQLTDDIRRLSEHRFLKGRIEAGWPVPVQATILGQHPVMVYGAPPDEEHVGPATVEPHVVFDATAGPIHVGSGSHIHAFTRLVGPCYIGSNVTVMGGEITKCSIGSVCKVRGEMSNTIMLGYSNKGHDGFVGHSYLGRWVNVGASTVTSNLKNTYGSVALWTPHGVRDTGLQFLGTLFGDHVKTGIGLRLTTGTVLGAGANVYDRMPPKVVAPFAWGAGPPYAVYGLDKFLETAERMMGRRHVSLSDRMRRHLAAAHARRWSAESDE